MNISKQFEIIRDGNGSGMTYSVCQTRSMVDGWYDTYTLRRDGIVIDKIVDDRCDGKLAVRLHREGYRLDR